MKEALTSKNESFKSALQWAYAIDPIPRQHWLDKGHDEEYANASGHFLGRFKQIIQSLRTGTVSDRVVIDFDIQGEDGNYISAGHDDLLLPYWEEFAAALKHWSEYCSINKCLEVWIWDIELPKVVLDMLRPAFEHSRIEKVLFRGSCHPRDLADFVSKVLQNHFVIEFHIDDISFAQEDMETICSAIKSRNAGGQFIKFVDLNACFVDGIENQTLNTILETIAAAKSNDIILCLEKNGMSSREAGVIAEFLSSNPNLPNLHVPDNRFNDADAEVLANALLNNTNLDVLSVENNRMSESGRLAFLRTMFDVSSLSSCAASNHSCQVRGLEQDISALNSNESTSWNKWEKIFAMLALSSEDMFINTTLLQGAPAQLIPALLSKTNYEAHEDDGPKFTDLYLELTDTKRSKKHDVWDNLGNTKSLNCMYELMRCWVVSSIFV